MQITFSALQIKQAEGYAFLFSTIFVIVQIALGMEELEKVGGQRSRFRFRLEAASVRKADQAPVINPSQDDSLFLVG